MEKRELLVLNPQHNVGMALSRLEVGTEARFSCESRDYTVVVKDEIPPLHKVALEEIPERGPVLKYGHMIGRAMQRIQPGMHVHTHNLEDEYGSL